MSCIFCDIINKKEPADIIYEDVDFLVLKDIAPSAPIHLLLIPKKHINSVNDLTETDKELLGGLFLLAKRMAKEQGTGEGYKLSFNVGEKGGQLVNHLHLHLKGGWKN